MTTGKVGLSYIRRQTVPEPRCCRSECSVTKRTLCATDDQCSSVGRTQSSDAGVGDESAVVSQVAWDVAGQTPMNKRDDLVADALPHWNWKPVQLAKDRWDVVTSSRVSDYGSSIAQTRSWICSHQRRAVVCRRHDRVVFAVSPVRFYRRLRTGRRTRYCQKKRIRKNSTINRDTSLIALIVMLISSPSRALWCRRYSWCLHRLTS